MDTVTLTLCGVGCSVVVHGAVTISAKAALPRSSYILATEKVRRRNDNIEYCRHVSSFVSARKKNQAYWPWLWTANLRRRVMLHPF